VVTGDSSLTTYRVNAGGDVTRERISGGDVWSGVLCVDPVTGRQVVVYGAYSDDGTSTIRVRTRA
jgi:hypothetical protein